uniref:Uncharacterized protein n=1 Tax=Leptocylindrus danicus TaxID=163516 RepID=A0A7S2JVW2_9STRA|mmetsp:Transcript_11980/g.18077  ORF Transcript_11980/g.18077 Transcript_11980/m.18077 type:complete len:108 (+) Transcript_11980:106-429(+)
MTYRSRGRSLFEVIVAVVFVGFLVGFITVLCIGNYFRAKRAQERQRQRRLAKQASAQQKQIYTSSASSGYVAHRNNGGPASPHSTAYTSQEVEMNQGYEPPVSVAQH